MEEKKKIILRHQTIRLASKIDDDEKKKKTISALAPFDLIVQIFFNVGKNLIRSEGRRKKTSIMLKLRMDNVTTMKGRPQNGLGGKRGSETHKITRQIPRGRVRRKKEVSFRSNVQRKALCSRGKNPVVVQQQQQQLSTCSRSRGVVRNAEIIHPSC